LVAFSAGISAAAERQAPPIMDLHHSYSLPLTTGRRWITPNPPPALQKILQMDALFTGNFHSVAAA